MLAILLAAVTLPPCPRTPNCVSTQATDKEHGIAPIHYSGAPADAMKRLVGILKNIPRTTITSTGGDGNTVRAQFRTLVFRFVDDAVFVIDDTTKTIHFRSASRLGRSDFGVNRRRMEEIRAAFETPPATQ
jgi:uncharacterized protein (DUF1499 family)